tara:strand:+ start:1135 stop:1425 length:291 start_codon:yes stop_codon:yes gene_type:complete
LIGDEPFAVLLPDDVISAQKSCLQQMVAAMRVSSKDASSYGMLDIEKEQGPARICQGHGRKASLGARALKLCSHRPLYLTAIRHAKSDQDQTRCRG